MPTFNGNCPFLAVNGVSISTYFSKVDLEGTNSTVDTTSGACASHVERAAGLNDTTISLTLAYHPTLGPVSLLQSLQRGSEVEIEYGPEGQASGKLRHVQRFVIESIAWAQTVTKEKVEFEISASGSAAPTVDSFAGGVYV